MLFSSQWFKLSRGDANHIRIPSIWNSIAELLTPLTVIVDNIKASAQVQLASGLHLRPAMGEEGAHKEERCGRTEQGQKTRRLGQEELWVIKGALIRFRRQ